MVILITGASGLIGSALTEFLLQQGHTVVHLGRSPRTGKVPCYAWDISNGKLDARALKGVEVIIHLAGAGVAEKRWTAQRKKEILESRIQSSRLLYDTLSKGGHSVKTFISASAIGYYGFLTGEEGVTEDHPAGNDFLADVVRQWEESVDGMTTLGIRLVKLRIGMVLSDKGGVLQEIVRPIKLFAGAPLGSGRQIMSWIHIQDLCRIFHDAITHSKWAGAYNAVTNQPCANRELTHKSARLLHRPLWLPPVPEFVLRLMLGQMAEIVVNGCRVIPQRALQEGFRFYFPDLDSALSDLLLKR